MTKNYLLHFFFLIAFTMSFGQTKDQYWRVDLGVNFIDTYPTGDMNSPLGVTGDLFQDFFNISNHWNASIPTLSIARYITSGFSIGTQQSWNSITKVEGATNVNYPYYHLDGFITYRPLENSLIQPFIKGGYGLSNFDLNDNDLQVSFLSKNTSKTFFGGIGVDLMYSDNVGISFQSSFRNAIENYGIDHFQHTITLFYQWGNRDSDGDGIADKKDACPDVPGIPEFDGCPDSDNDGIQDKEDACPLLAGTAALKGCPDTDGDGIADHEDLCPEVAGLLTMSGCPDSDSDGVSDAEDECPETSGSLENKGCPWPDTDGDGVFDKDDLCPDTEGTTSNDGCPEISSEIIETLNKFGAKINFMADSDLILGRKTRAVLDDIKNVLMANPEGHLLIEGYASEEGSEEYNQNLSFRRAEAVRDYLVKLGVDQRRLEVLGFGEINPIGDNSKPEGRAENRRVQFRPKP
ncbi:OmpA family protein [Flavobacteriaceae bacterium]|jgi:OmpA-OmpF porin, OOP family|nr:OmpA family protein [Flavobacteriaceae bacterium]